MTKDGGDRKSDLLIYFEPLETDRLGGGSDVSQDDWRDEDRGCGVSTSDSATSHNQAGHIKKHLPQCSLPGPIC